MSRVLFILIIIAVLTSAVKESIKSIDLDELSPKENNCRVSETSSSTIKCSKIPLFCRSVCEQAKRLSFDANLKRISPFSFGAYKIKQSLEVNFGSSLKHIDTDAFNGMIVEEDAVLYINIGDTDDDSLVPTNKEGEKIENVEKTEDVRKEEEDEKQIEYDIETPSTKPDIQASQANDRMGLKSLNVAPNAFRGLLIKEGARVLITIRKYDKIEFGAQSVVNMKQMSNSVLSFAISDTGLVLFREKCADSWKPYVDDYLDPSGNNDYDGKTNIDYSSDQSPIEHVLFKFSLVGVSKVLFEREAFSNMRLFNSSTFQIQVINFDVAMLGKSSFSNMVQQKKSNFELTLANGKETELSEGLFSDLVQGESSKFIIYFRLDKNSKSDRKDQLCLGEGTFGHLSQAENSTVRLTFLTQNIRLSFGSKSLNEVRQSLGSIIQVYVSGAKEVRFEAESLVNVSQALGSSLEIWVSRSGNFEVAARAFRGINQGERSTVRLGYTDGQSLFDQGNHFVSAYVQSPFAFDKWNSTQTSMLVYEFTKGANFKLKFPPRPIPRMLITSNNETVEEAAMRLFPSLGRLSRPDTISLNEYELRGRDFCRIVDIPFDVLVRVSPKTECSCALLYLYRVVRRVRPELLAVSGVTPACYRERLSSPGFLETEERACDFDSKVRECHQRSENDGQNNGWECRASSFEYYDERTLTVNTTPSTPVVDTANDDLNSEDDLIDDSSAEKSTEIYDDWLTSDAIITSNDVVASGVQETKEEPASNNQIDLGESTMDDDEDEDDEDDDDDDESEEDEDDPNRLTEEMNSEDGNDILLGVDNTEKRRSKPLSISRFESLRRFLVHSTLFELGVIAATALTLIVIVLVVLAILMRRVRCCSPCRSCCVKKHGFTEYYDDEDDEDDDEFIEKPSKYSLYENANANDYAVVVKCDETSKTKSALAHCLRDDVSHCSSTTGLINVKSNPLGNV